VTAVIQTTQGLINPDKWWFKCRRNKWFSFDLRSSQSQNPLLFMTKAISATAWNSVKTSRSWRTQAKKSATTGRSLAEEPAKTQQMCHAVLNSAKVLSRGPYTETRRAPFLTVDARQKQHPMVYKTPV